MPKILFTGTNPSQCRVSGDIVHQSLICLERVENNALVDLAIHQLPSFDWIVFTSRYTVEFFFERIKQLGLDLGACKVVSIGRTTSAMLQKQGIVPDLQPELESSTGIIELFRQSGFAPQKILIPRSDKALSVLPEGLRLLGHEVLTVVVYTNRLPKDTMPYDLGAIEVLVFTSPSTVTNFRQVYGDIPKHKKLYVQGEETEKELAKWIDFDHFEPIKR